MKPLFVYGTLLVDDIISLLIGRVPVQEEAVLEDFCCYYVQGATFPGITPFEGGQVNGQLLMDLSLEELSRLDDYEDVFYIRRQVDVNSFDQTIEAHAYVVEASASSVLSDRQWTLEEFRRLHFTSYLERMRGGVG